MFVRTRVPRARTHGSTLRRLGQLRPPACSTLLTHSQACGTAKLDLSAEARGGAFTDGRPEIAQQMGLLKHGDT